MPRLPQICADDRRLEKEEASSTKGTKKHKGQNLTRIADDAVLRKPNLTAKARRHGEMPRLPQICADERRLEKVEASTPKDTKEHKGRKT